VLIDLHAHTLPLSHDSSLTADELIEAAKAAGLDGICLTEHDFAWDPEEVGRLARRHRFLVLPGMEVNTEHGHVLAFGLSGYRYGMHRVSELARLAAQEGAVLLAAHPYRRQIPWEPGDDGRRPEGLARALRNPRYGVEVAVGGVNGRGSGPAKRFSLELAGGVCLLIDGGSGAHAREDVGRCATEFTGRIEGLEDLLEALRRGRFRALWLDRAQV